jgi:uncharacterized iron-regulated protein
MRALPFVSALLILAAGCAAPPAGPELPDVDILLLGELHDAAQHPQLQLEWVSGFARRRALAALALEMSERGHTTAGLPASATEAQVQRALGWNAAAWPWERYGPAIMAAVRAGVPVIGANLPRIEIKPAMLNTALDQLLPGERLAAQQQAIRAGHCNVLPEHQVVQLTRVQMARDRNMAEAVQEAVRPRKTVVLLAGAGHVHPELGVPHYLPQRLSVQPVVLPAPPPAAGGPDYCEQMRRLPRPSSVPD